MMTVVTGGSGSGKSAFAEDKIVSFGPAKRIYIATMHPYDEESHSVWHVIGKCVQEKVSRQLNAIPD